MLALCKTVTQGANREIGVPEEGREEMQTDKPMAVFDMDGTLYKTECVSLRAVHSAIHDAGLPDTDDDTIRSLFAYTTPDLCAMLFPELGPEALHALSESVRSYERSLIRTHGELYAGIREMLGFLKEGGLVDRALHRRVGALCENDPLGP